jgi:hypothetical protein
VKRNLRAWLIALPVAVGALVGASVSAYRIEAEAVSRVPQDTINLERRISALEQRFYIIESSINRLEQQAALNTRTTPPASQRDLELDLLRRQTEALQGQLNEIACALVKLDERTLPASVREAQKRSGKLNTDPCRLNPETPLQLSTRP